jgi:hypothetical protein
MTSPAQGRTTQRGATTDRVTVALVPKAVGDLQRTVERTGLSKTDIINRAISLYEYLDARVSDGAELLVRNKSGEVEQIKFF